MPHNAPVDKETIKYILYQFSERSLPRCIERDLVVPLDSGKVICLVGIRRSGKTFLLFNTIQRLLATGTDRRQILYLNFEDDRLFPVHVDEMDMILRAHGELFPDMLEKKRYIFLDEIQAVIGWERYVRRIYDTENVELFITGSSSELLARSLATALRGRSVFYDVFPLSFREFLRFRKLEYRPYSTNSEIRIRHALEEYVKWGSLPEVVLADPEMKSLILEEYVSLLFYRDILERFGVRNESMLRLLMKTCCSHPACLISVNKLYHDFKSMGFAVSKNTLYDYLNYLEEAHILFTLPVYTQSLRKQSQNPRKLHLIDVGLVQTYRPDPDSERGRKLENVVFLHERRKSRHIFYYQGKHEIDLIIEGPALVYLNTTWSISSPETMRRETAAMAFGAQKFPNAKGILICHENPSKTNEFPFMIKTAWKHLLDQ